MRKGKRGGAFCATVLPAQTPWVLVNYTGKVRDVATLAHELGHAIHSMMAEHHSLLTQHPSLPLAETASVFAEMLLTERLLAEEPDPLVRRELLAGVGGRHVRHRDAPGLLRASSSRRRTRPSCDNQSPEELNATVHGEPAAEQFGDSVEIGDEFRYEWVSIPHIYNTPFYCYAYSFGQLLVLALYRRYQQEGDAFKPGYLQAAGATAARRIPVDILREAGVDIADPAFWQGGFDVIRDMIDELEAIEV